MVLSKDSILDIDKQNSYKKEKKLIIEEGIIEKSQMTDSK